MSEQSTTIQHNIPENAAANYVIVELREFPGYGVDCLGNVYSRRSINGKRGLLNTWRSMKPLIFPGRRYSQVSLFGGRIKREIHTLVAIAFLGPRPPGMQVAHKNGNSYDNRVENLVYATCKENASHKKLHGTYLFGEKCPSAKLSDEQARTLRSKYLAGGVFMKELAAEFGVSVPTISVIVNQKRRKEMV